MTNGELLFSYLMANANTVKYSVQVALSCVLLLYALWIFYIAVMGLKRVRDVGQLSKTAAAFGYPVLIVGLMLDLIANLFPLTILLLELPRETTVTARLKRHNRSVPTSGLQRWRKAVAAWAEPLLDPFDPSGDHI